MYNWQPFNIKFNAEFAMQLQQNLYKTVVLEWRSAKAFLASARPSLTTHALDFYAIARLHEKSRNKGHVA